jgi:hypothetical protein
MELEILWLDMVFGMSVERTSNGKSKNKGNGWIVEPSGCTPAIGRVEAAARQVFDARAKEGDEKVWSQPSKEDPGLSPALPPKNKSSGFSALSKVRAYLQRQGQQRRQEQATAKAQCGGLSTAAAKALPPVEMTSLSFGFEEKQQK